MIERLKQDPDFAEQFVNEFFKLKEESKEVIAQAESVVQHEKEAQMALRQAKGFNVYLKGKQESFHWMELERQKPLRQVEGASIVLKVTNTEVKERLEAVKKTEIEAKLALRQAHGVSAYLRKKSTALEKQLEAARDENTARMALQQAKSNKFALKSTMMENGMACSEHSRHSLHSDHCSISTDENTN